MAIMISCMTIIKLKRRNIINSIESIHRELDVWYILLCFTFDAEQNLLNAHWDLKKQLV